MVRLAVALLLIAAAEALSPPSPPKVDLGYHVYEGYFNASSNLNIFKGIRFAAPPIGRLRWQAPQPPKSDRSQVIKATEPAPRCAQSNIGLTYTPLTPASEDCLFLDVYAPRSGRQSLPVFVWMHGGGYGVGDAATYDPSLLINSNDNGFIAVILQYRMGAFGFLSSEEVFRRGTPNAGILDQKFAFEWVQKHIQKFGGDPRRVTIAGQSAGGGSVMYHAMGNGGTLGTSLFTNIIAQSPYLAPQYLYNEARPTSAYNAFAEAAGCAGASPSVFDCLISRDTQVLQDASQEVIGAIRFGEWAFQPVTDTKYIRDLPSRQLRAKKVNGLRIFTGTVAEEGFGLTPTNITNEADFEAYLRNNWPNFSESQLQELSDLYAIDADNPTRPFSSTGLSAPTILEVGPFAVGQQQRAFTVNGETLFHCVAYWLAEAFAATGTRSWLYQFSYPPAYHTGDLFPLGFLRGLNAPIPVPVPQIKESLAQSWRRAWGNFIIRNDPGWAAWDNRSPVLQNFNVSGGYPVYDFEFVGFTAARQAGDTVLNNKVVAARPWEGGRGARCQFWRENGPSVPQ